MIVSVRRTDVPVFYINWFYKRLKEGYVLVKNPFNYHQVNKVSLSLDVIECFVFWSKNPSGMINNLHIDGYLHTIFSVYFYEDYSKNIVNTNYFTSSRST